MVKRKSACAFTGHRPNRFIFNYNEKHPLCVKIKETILAECRRLYEMENVNAFYTGCALGVDMWGAEAVIQLKEAYPDIKLHCAAPFPNHTEKWVFEQDRRLHKIVCIADTATFTSKEYAADAYKIRNYYMVDNSQFLIAVFDNEKNMRSGTMQTVNYALQKGLKISFIHPDTATISK